MIIGIQGDEGSWNEKACEQFCEQKNIESYEIKYLLSTQNVLRALESGKIDLGIFAVSSQGVAVDETEEVIGNYKFVKVDEIFLNISLVTLGYDFPRDDVKQVLGHSQAFKFVKKEINLLYPEAVFAPVDGKNMFEELKNNNIVIGNKMYQEIYGLKVFDELQTEYSTTFFIVKQD